MRSTMTVGRYDEPRNTNVNESAVVRFHRLFCWLGQHKRNPSGHCVECGYDDIEPYEIDPVV